jgi:hypothetical protein
MDPPASSIHPNVVAEIARWWQECLRAAEVRGVVLTSPDPGEVAARFHCSEEEALRGLTAGEQLHWG